MPDSLRCVLANRGNR
ncbi:unnamed protein product, partial [Rotaria socialis]